MGFSKKYEEIYATVSNHIEDIQNIIIESIPNSDKLKFQLENYFQLPSKHIRAVLTLLYLKANAIEISERQLIYQAIIELVHNGSLIHDDVIDSSDKRRGAKSFNANFGEHFSVIAGDYVLSFALKLIIKLNSFEILNIFSETFSKMCQGEISQHFSAYKIPTIEEYIEKSYNKTGALFEAALCGAEFLASGKINDSTKEFAKNFGIAFQIKNDIKNVLSPKNDDSDIKNGIYTAPVIYSDSLEDLSSGIEKAKVLLDNYIQKAKSAIEDLPENIYKNSIRELLGLLRDE